MERVLRELMRDTKPIVERVPPPRKPEWVRRAEERALPAKDMTKPSN